MIKEKLVDKVMLFTSPKILGGDAKSVIGPLGIKELKDVINLKDTSCMSVGKDILIEGYI
jgi:diaminohydroxyphosphoribosylaminopyrimidine deaminase/5-amino-6-(5-phosphoribosylamino)uracil reductase